ncbi:MAG TPA: hypothetical protein VNO14_13015 [Blastocatellia bacterium]|nr:hypothetical protein [Blastocatellia bacterium]
MMRGNGQVVEEPESRSLLSREHPGPEPAPPVPREPLPPEPEPPQEPQPDIVPTPGLPDERSGGAQVFRAYVQQDRSILR